MGVLGTIWRSANSGRRSLWAAIAKGSEKSVNGALGPRAERISPSAEGLNPPFDQSSSEIEGAVDRWGSAYDSAAGAVGAPLVRALFLPDVFQGAAPSMTWPAVVDAARAGGASPETLEGLGALRQVHDRASELLAAGGVQDVAEREYISRLLPKLLREWSAWVSSRFPRRASQPPPPPSPPAPPPAPPPEPSRSSGSGGGTALAILLALGALALGSKRRKRHG